MNKEIIKKILGPKGTKTVASLLIKDWAVKNKVLKNIQNQEDKNPKPLKLVGFVKCFNEGSNGNLERCLKHMSSFCDDIVVCDDSSTDNSLEIALKFTNNIIRMPDEFKKELEHKQKLLELALSLDPDWIVFLDPDEVFDRFGENNGIRSLCRYGKEKNIDGFAFLEFNLWEDLSHYRTDELWLQNWQIRLWKNNGKLKFEIKEELHNNLFPKGICKFSRSEIKVIHYGFASEDKVNKKISTYQSLGQSGKDLERIKDETGLKLKSFSRDWFPLSTQKIIVVCLIYKSIGYLNFIYDQFKKYTAHLTNVEFLFIANDPTEKVIKHLEKNQLSHLIFRNKDPNEYYINRVYKAYNFGGMNADGDILVFINSDFAFSKNWMENLIRNLREDRIVTSRLVESGKLTSGKHATSKDFGTTYKNFRDEEFQSFAEKTFERKLVSGGLYMPCAIFKDIFVKSGGYPEGNRTGKNGKIISGDKIFFDEILKPMGIKHYTAYDSIVYHIQEGEKDD